MNIFIYIYIVIYVYASALTIVYFVVKYVKCVAIKELLQILQILIPNNRYSLLYIFTIYNYIYLWIIILPIMFRQ